MVVVPASVVMVASTTGVEPVACRGEAGPIYSRSRLPPGPCHRVVDRDRVDAGPAEDVVPIAVVREDEIASVASARPFVLVAPKVEAVVAAFAGEVVPAGVTLQLVVVSAAVEIVVAIVAAQELKSFGASII